MSTDVQTGQATPTVDRQEFGRRFRLAYDDPALRAARDALAQVEELAWRAYADGRKAPRTRPAREADAEPRYKRSEAWIAQGDPLRQAHARQQDKVRPSRVLLACGSTRNDGSRLGDIAERVRVEGLVRLAQQALQQAGFEVDLLDLGQAGDWMGEIQQRWTAAHGVMIMTAAQGYQVPGVLKRMIDCLACADGGKPDPTSTQGQDPKRANPLDLAGRPYPRRLARRAYGVVVHADVAGIESTRRALCDWLDWMGLIDACEQARLDRYIGYYQPCAASQGALDADEPMQQEVMLAAQALAHVVGELRSGRQREPDWLLRRSRP